MLFLVQIRPAEGNHARVILHARRTAAVEMQASSR
jgi:hypothetical protein